MKTLESIPRFSFIWLLIAQAVLLFPHLLRTPLLVLPLWLFCVAWRLMIFKQRWSLPSGFVKTLLVVLSIVAIRLLERRLVTLDSFVLLLIVAFLLKLIEMQTRRDLLLLIYLSFFVIATQLLFDQDLLSAGYLLVSVLLTVTALISIYTQLTKDNLYYPLKVACQILLSALPIMVAAFLLFPRIGPLWSMPNPSSQGKTGMTDTLMLGSISSLAESDELVFRAAFSGETPALSQLYWRGLVLDSYDGERWKPTQATPVKENALLYQELASNTHFHYQQIVEAHYKNWLFPLDGVITSEPQELLLDDYTLQAKELVQQRGLWHMESVPDAAKIQALTQRQKRYNTFLPAQQNPQTREWAQQLWQQSADAEQYLQKILSFFHHEHFVYTLTPPILGKHAVDDFLFNTRRGFCEHYATAFVTLARMVDLPARIVVGYQGGDSNPFEKTVTVRQLDAHAWAEVWIDGKGWLRFDPTYAVAPERIEKGSQESLHNEPRFLAQSPLSSMKLTQISWFKQLQYRFDQLNYLWHSSVLSYQSEQQSQLLARLFGELSIKKMALFLTSVFFVVALSIWLFLTITSKQQKYTPEQKAFARFLKKLAKAGFVKKPYQGAQEFATIVSQGLPHKAQQIDIITKQYNQLRYSNMDATQKQYVFLQFQRNIREFSVK